MSNRNKINQMLGAEIYQTTYINHFDRIKEIAQSVFKWINAPSEIDLRFLENAILLQNHGAFFLDEDLDSYLFTRCSLSGDLDFYDNPTGVDCYASNGYNRHLINNKECVIIYDNMGRYPLLPHIENYAKRLTALDMAIDINTNAQKTPLLLTCSEKQRQTMINLYEKYDGNVPYIFGYKDLEEMNKIQALKTDAPFLIDRLQEQKTNVWNECLTMLGVPNVSIEKGERLIKDEVNQQNGGIFASRNSRLKARKQACEQINRLYGLSMSVEYDEISDEAINKDTSESEGVYNE